MIDWLMGIWLTTALYWTFGAYNPPLLLFYWTNPFLTCEMGIMPGCCAWFMGPKLDMSLDRIYWFWFWDTNVGTCCCTGGGMRWLEYGYLLLMIACIFCPDDIGISCCCCCCCWAILELRNALNLILSNYKCPGLSFLGCYLTIV